ncbi:MAG: MGMT family protein [Phycisphaerae bacterium]|jgi:O-6-methylguanine DNA methyltransferase
MPIGGLKYVVFKTKAGFFGLLADENGLKRTVLPQNSHLKAEKYLLVGTQDRAKESNVLYSELQKAIKAYYNTDNGDLINFAKLFSGLIFFKGTEFTQKVLKTCMKIPPGQTITYAQLAKKAGFPKAARAVGSVLAKNKLPLIIPCHRVVRADGKIGNFSAPGGTKLKKRMLEHEKGIGFGV